MCILGELSQHNVAPQVWQVRKCNHSSPVLIHSSHTYSLDSFNEVTCLMCTHTCSSMLLIIIFHSNFLIRDEFNYNFFSSLAPLLWRRVGGEALIQKAHLTILIVPHGFHNFSLGVHHKRAMAHEWFINRFAGT